MCHREDEEEEKAEKKTVWTQQSVCLCLHDSPLDSRVKGHEEKSRRRRRRRGEPVWMKFSVSCQYVWTLTDHRLRKRERHEEERAEEKLRLLFHWGKKQQQQQQEEEAEVKCGAPFYHDIVG